MGFLRNWFNESSPPILTGLPIQTSVNALPLPIIYGSPRVAPNVIYVNDFKATKISGTGTKGLLGGGKGQQNVQYSATILFGIGEGPIVQVLLIFEDNGIFYIGNTPPGQVFNLFFGNPGQLPWSYLVSNHPSDALAYPDTAYLASANMNLDSAAIVPQFSLMVQGIFAGTSPLSPINLSVFGAGLPTLYFADADVAECVNDLLTNSRYGIGFPNSLIDGTTVFGGPASLDPTQGDNSLQAYCQSVGMAFSVNLSSAEACSAILQRWMDLVSVAIVWTGTVLKFIPYWDSFEGTNPGYNATLGAPKRYYSPLTQPLFFFNDDNFLPAGENEDPVTLERTDIIDVMNTVRVRFLDRNVEFNDNVAEAKDEASIQTLANSPNNVVANGVRVDDLTGSGEFTLQAYAAAAAAVRLYRNVSVRNKYTFRLPVTWCFLDPMDIVAISDFSLGLNQVAVRIVSIEEDEKMELTIVAEEYPVGGLSPFFATSPTL